MAFWDQEENIGIIDKNKVECIESKWVKKGDKEYITYNVVKKTSDGQFTHTGETVVIPIDKFKELNDKILAKIEEKKN